MAQPQLRLVNEHPAQPSPTDPVRIVFDHWLFMSGRSPARCKLGPTRAAAIAAALTLYDVDMVLQAIDGMAADPLTDCRAARIRDAMREIEWFLATEARIERWANAGEALHQAAAAEMQRRDAPPVSSRPDASTALADAAAAEAARARLRQVRQELAKRMRGA